MLPGFNSSIPQRRFFHTCLSVQCFVVATLASVTPAEPFLFRNYEHPLASTALGKKIQACPGSSSHQVWEAVRASSAAPYYLDDFKCGNDRLVPLQPVNLLMQNMPS